MTNRLTMTNLTTSWSHTYQHLRYGLCISLYIYKWGQVLWRSRVELAGGWDVGRVNLGKAKSSNIKSAYSGYKGVSVEAGGRRGLPHSPVFFFFSSLLLHHHQLLTSTHTSSSLLVFLCLCLHLHFRYIVIKFIISSYPSSVPITCLFVFRF